MTPTGQVLRESVAALEVLEAAAEASRFRTHRQASRPGAPERAGPAAAASARGSAWRLAWHGAGFTGSGEVHIASVASIELTDLGAVRILTGSTEMGQGTKTIFPQLVAAELGIEIDEVEVAAQDTSIAGARLGADGRVADGHGRRWPADHCIPQAPWPGRSRHRGLLRRFVPRLRPRARPIAHRRAVRALPRCALRRRHLHRRRLPGVRLGLRRGARRRRPGHRRGDGPGRGRGGRRRPHHPPRPGGGARSRAARCRRSATPRSRRSSSSTGAT